MPTLSVALAGATLVSFTTFSSAQAAQITLSNYEIPENLIWHDTSGTFDRPNIFFNEPTDTIQISGQTVLGEESTYEARIYFPTNGGAGGRVFNEWKGSLEDKTLYAGPGGLAGFNWPLYPGVALGSGTPLVPNTWHHIAFVQGGGTQRLYLNGQIVGTRPAAGDIGDSDGGGFVGAIFRDGGIAPSFIGHLDTLRVSNVARYSGDSFEAPTGDLLSDSNTQILYNFNLDDYYQQDGSTWVSDLSGNGRNGRLSTGFNGASSPNMVIPNTEELQSVPEPTSALGLLAFGAACASSRLLRKGQQKSQRQLRGTYRRSPLGVAQK
jgi:hypothetical protein